MDRVGRLLSKAQSLSQEAGCYLMKDRNGRVIYVGKAKRLKNRVSSYFNQSAKGLKTEFLVSHIEDFDFIITRTEAESYILENNLIKEHNPKYNIRLRDDKSYPYLQVNWNEDFPRLEYVRRPKKMKGVEIVGPFPTGFNLSLALRILTKSFSLRDCSLSEFKSRKNPCLLYQMKQCSAPCVKLISKEKYLEDLKVALGFFQGSIRAKRTIDALKSKMEYFSESEDFELAAITRDQISSLEDFISKSFDQKVEMLRLKEELDVWSFYEGSAEVDISLYLIRSGSLLGHKNFHFIKTEFVDDLEMEVFSKIVEYYSQHEEVLPEIVTIDAKTEDLTTLGQVLHSIGIKETKKPTKKYLPILEMCRKHAEESQRVRIKNQDSVFIGLNKLKELLKLKERPKILECFDIAIWQGQSPTASKVVFNEGTPDKKNYRYYHLALRPEGNNDFAMMAEVIQRRMKDENLPDVLIVDGGVAQVNIVISVLKEFGINLPALGIAKSRDLSSGNLRAKDVERSQERLIIPGRVNPYILEKCPSLFKIIVSMRDEAHRFSRKLHHKAESERVIKSWVEEIKGLGSDVKAKIFQNLSVSQEELKNWTVGELTNFFGISPHQAKVLWKHLHPDSE